MSCNEQETDKENFPEELELTQAVSVETNKEISSTTPHTFPETKSSEDEVSKETIKTARAGKFMFLPLHSFITRSILRDEPVFYFHIDDVLGAEKIANWLTSVNMPSTSSTNLELPDALNHPDEQEDITRMTLTSAEALRPSKMDVNLETQTQEIDPIMPSSDSILESDVSIPLPPKEQVFKVSSHFEGGDSEVSVPFLAKAVPSPTTEEELKSETVSQESDSVDSGSIRIESGTSMSQSPPKIEEASTSLDTISKKHAVLQSRAKSYQPIAARPSDAPRRDFIQSVVDEIRKKRPQRYKFAKLNRRLAKLKRALRFQIVPRPIAPKPGATQANLNQPSDLLQQVGTSKGNVDLDSSDSSPGNRSEVQISMVEPDQGDLTRSRSDTPDPKFFEDEVFEEIIKAAEAHDKQRTIDIVNWMLTVKLPDDPNAKLTLPIELYAPLEAILSEETTSGALASSNPSESKCTALEIVSQDAQAVSVETNKEISSTTPHTFPETKSSEDEVSKETIKTARAGKFMFLPLHSFITRSILRDEPVFYFHIDDVLGAEKIANWLTSVNMPSTSSTNLELPDALNHPDEQEDITRMTLTSAEALRPSKMDVNLETQTQEIDPIMPSSDSILESDVSIPLPPKEQVFKVSSHFEGGDSEVSVPFLAKAVPSPTTEEELKSETVSQESDSVDSGSIRIESGISMSQSPPKIEEASTSLDTMNKMHAASEGGTKSHQPVSARPSDAPRGDFKQPLVDEIRKKRKQSFKITSRPSKRKKEVTYPRVLRLIAPNPGATQANLNQPSDLLQQVGTSKGNVDLDSSDSSPGNRSEVQISMVEPDQGDLTRSRSDTPDPKFFEDEVFEEIIKAAEAHDKQRTIDIVNWMLTVKLPDDPNAKLTLPIELYAPLEAILSEETTSGALASSNPSESKCTALEIVSQDGNEINDSPVQHLEEIISSSGFSQTDVRESDSKMIVKTEELGEFTVVASQSLFLQVKPDLSVDLQMATQEQVDENPTD
ncbi:hypothetical protein Aperf_G00000063984 [Anoplocephala perfoliata]